MAQIDLQKIYDFRQDNDRHYLIYEIRNVGYFAGTVIV